MKKRFVLLFTIIFALSIFAFGCQNTAQQRPLDPNQSDNVRPNDKMNTPNAGGTTLSDNEVRAMVKKLTKIAENVQGVKRASIVISDRNMSNMGNTGNVGNNAPNLNTTNNNKQLNKMNNNRNMTNNNIRTPGMNNPNIGNTTGTPSPNAGITDNTSNIRNTGNANNVGRTGTPGLPGVTNNMDNAIEQGNRKQIVVMVGLELDDNAMNNTANTDNIARNVANKIKASDDQINQVFVTSDRSLMERIDSVATDVGRKPFNALGNDIDNLWRTLTAQGPAF